MNPRDCFVISNGWHLFPVKLFNLGKSFRIPLCCAIVVMSPFDIIALDGANMSLLRRRTIRAVSVAVRAREVQ